MSFADYPEPEEGPDTGYAPTVGSNPVLRGIPLLLGGNLIARVGPLQQLLWGNAGFGSIKDIPELDDMPMRFHPVVTPLGETGPMLPFEPELTQPKLLSDEAAAAEGSAAPKYYTAADYHELYKSGRLTPLQVAQTLLGVINDGDGKYADAWAPKHGGEDERALEAARLSAERYAAGRPLGVLDGVPVGVKDDVDVEGYVSHVGMRYDPAASCFRPSAGTAWPVRRLQEAGAVVISKNRMHELGSDTSGCNPAQGTPTNHCNPAYYPGGSTSGGGSALGAGVVPLAVGTDAGGSIRIPACFNGVYGLKATHHRVRPGHKMTTAVVSPLAASVADLTIAYRLMAQPPDDPSSSSSSPDGSGSGSSGSIFARSEPPPPGSKKVLGIYKDWWADADPRVRAACDKAVSWLRDHRGYDVIDVSIPFVPQARTAHAVLCVSEMHESARRRHPPDPLSLVGPANKLLLAVASRTPASDYLKCNALRELVMRHLAFLHRAHPGLLLLAPTSPMAGWPRHPGDAAHGFSDADATVRNMMYVFLSNLAGTPSLSAPAGYVEPDRGEGRLPVGLLAMGEWGAEERLLAWARDMEVYLHEGLEGGRVRPRTWFDVVAATEAEQKKQNAAGEDVKSQDGGTSE